MRFFSTKRPGLQCLVWALCSFACSQNLLSQSLASNESLDLAQQMYVAYYGRPGDHGGIDWWASKFDSSNSIDSVLSSFGSSAEFEGNFGALSNEELVDGLYQQMYNRDADSIGMAFYRDRLDNGGAKLASIAKLIAAGSQRNDLLILNNKIQVANAFTNEIFSRGLDYGPADISSTQQLLAAVDSTESSVNAALALVSQWQPSADHGLNEGFFAGTVISGLTYTTASQTGVTDGEGKYLYRTGETVTFSLGGTTLGSEIQARATMALHDLVPNAILYTRSNKVRAMQLGNRPLENRTFNRLHNVLTFLFSVDDDSDLDNGINISPAVNTLFADVQLDFEQGLTEFRSAPSLRVRIQKGAYSGLIASGITGKPGDALDEYYRIRGINHNLFVLTMESTDSDMDGNANSGISHTYNVFGDRLTRSTNSYGDPGTANTHSSYLYDAQGNLSSDSFDGDGDGQADRIYTKSYDAYGNSVIQEVDDNGDGATDHVVSNTYNASGQLLTSYIDVTDNDTENTLTTYTYDAYGNRLSYSYDKNGRNSTAIYSYDSENNLIAYSFDSNHVNIPDSEGSYTYDTDGNQLSESVDSNANGQVDSVKVASYDTNGNKLTEQQDNDGDGNWDIWVTRTYNDNSLLLSSSEDSNGDGSANVVSTYSYDADSVRRSSRFEAAHNAVVELSFTSIYDENGNLKTASEDTNGDGVTDNVTTYQYDGRKNLLTTSYDANMDGAPNKIEYYSYDANDNCLSFSIDDNADSFIDSVTQYLHIKTNWRGFLSEQR